MKLVIDIPEKWYRWAKFNDIANGGIVSIRNLNLKRFIGAQDWRLWMESQNKKNKCKRTLLDRGGEKGPIFKAKPFAMYHKKERIAEKVEIRKEMQSDESEDI